jgi:hypothetical protein
MRTAFFCLLLIVNCSTFAAGQEPRSGVQKSQQSGKTSGQQQIGHGQVSGANQAHAGSAPPKATHPLPLPKTGTHHAAPNTTQARSAGALQSTNAAAAALRENHATSNLRSVQLHTAPRPAQSPNNVRHRSPNPAILGGSVSPSAANTGALNGTRMSRRP